MNHVKKIDRYQTVVLWDIQVHERKLTPHALFVFSTSEMNDHILKAVWLTVTFITKPTDAHVKFRFKIRFCIYIVNKKQTVVIIMIMFYTKIYKSS